MRLILIACVFLSFGCASMTEDEKIQREEKFNEALDEYIAKKEGCSGFMVQKFSERDTRLRRVHPVELKMAECVSRVGVF